MKLWLYLLPATLCWTLKEEIKLGKGTWIVHVLYHNPSGCPLSQHEVKIEELEAEEMARQLSILAALPEDLGSILSTHL